MREHKRLRLAFYIGAAGVALLFICVGVVLHSQSFRNYALEQIVQAAQQSTGTRIAVKDMALTWRPLAIEFDGISAQSRGVSGRDPLFTAARVRVNLKLIPLLHRSIDVEEVDIERPAVYIRTAANGQTNLPAMPGDAVSDSGFETQIALLLIRDGLISYDDRQIPLSAELRNFHGQVGFDREANSYKGQIAYDAGRIETPQVRTFEHSAELRFVANAAHCVIESLDVAMLHSHLRAHGDLATYTSPVFTGAYSGEVSGEDLRWITRNASVPVGDMSLQGEVVYRTAQGATLLDRVILHGNFESGALIVPANKSKVLLKQVRAGYRLDGGKLYVDGVRAGAFGGRVTSDSNVINLKSSGGEFHVVVNGAAIQQAGHDMGIASHGMEVVGIADVDVSGKWKNNIGDATVKAHAVIRRPEQVQAEQVQAAKGVIPLEGVINVEYNAAQDRATFGASNLRTVNEQLSVTGVLSRNSSLNVHFASSDLHELGALIDSVTTSVKAHGLGAYDLHGSAEFTGKVSGAVKDPHFEGLLAASNLQIEGTTWRTLQGRVGADAHSVQIQDGSLLGQAKERVRFDGGIKLINWSVDPAAPLSLHASVQNVSAAEAQRLGRTSYPVTGLLSGELSLSGSERSPAGRGHVELVQGVVWNEPVNAFSVDFDADRQSVHVTSTVRAPAGAVTAKATYDLGSRRYQVQGQTQNLKLEQVHILQQRQDSVSGQLTAEVSGSGTLDDPQLSGRAQIPSLGVRGETFAGVDAQVTVRNKHADLSLHSAINQNQLQVKGGVELTGAYPATIALDTGSVEIGPLLDKFAPGGAQGATGQMEIHATLNGPLNEPAQIQAHAEIPSIRLRTKSIDLASAKPIKLDYRAGVLQVDSAELKGNGTDIRVSGSLPVQGAGDMNLSANGTLDLGLLQDWTGGGHSSGQVDVELTAKGKKTEPVIQGRVRIANAVYTSDSLPVGIESLNGDISIDGNRLQIAKLSGTAGGGTVSVSGSATYGNNTSFNLALGATSVRVRQNGVRAVVDANLAWSGTTTTSILGGRVTVDKLSFNQGSDLAEIISQLSGDNTVSDSSSSTHSVKLNVAVQSSNNLNLASSQLSIGGSANLNVVGNLADPIILGRVALTSGEVFFLGKRFEIQNGTIAFANTVRTEPVVSLYVNTVVDQYTITINLSGRVDHLKTSYTSDPSLSTADIINLLAFGQTTADAASNTTSPASLGAESAVASAAGSQVASQVQKLTGISQLTLNPLAGNNQNPGSQVAIQQRVSGNILLTFGTDVTDAQNQTIQVQYQVKRNVSVSVLRDEFGGYGFDVRYHKAF
jgi:translocation and assembly module TamB